MAYLLLFFLCFTNVFANEKRVQAIASKDRKLKEGDKAKGKKRNYTNKKKVQTISPKDQKLLGEYTLNFVKERAKIKGRKRIYYSDEYFDLFTALASINGKTADKYLVECLPYYKGSAPGAFYVDLVAKQGERVLTLLNDIKNRDNVCDSNLYSCNWSALGRIINMIKTKNYSKPNKDNIGGPFSYWKPQKILEKISEIKEYSE